MTAPQWQMARLMDGYLVTQMLHVAAALGVADALAERPRTSAELAAVVGAEPGALHRVLRGLATEDVVTEDDHGRFALTLAGELLRDGVPGSLRGAVLARGGLYHDAAGRMLAGVRGEGVPYELANGAPFFDDLAEHPEREAAFQASMAGRSDQEAGDVVAAYDFGGIDRLVDVGGGAGKLLAAILRSAPRLTGVLYDRPGVAPAAEARMPTRASRTAASSSPATSSRRCPRAPTPTSCRVCCTTGTTRTPAASSIGSVRRWATGAASWSSRPSCPSVPPTSRPPSGWT
jgi:hypothetical protein